jgi:hypothetical protein
MNTLYRVAPDTGDQLSRGDVPFKEPEIEGVLSDALLVVPRTLPKSS